MENVINVLDNGPEADLGPLIEAVLKIGQLPVELVDGVVSKDEDLRYNCYKVLVAIGRDRPELLYPYWDSFVDLLGSPNAYHRSAAVRLIAYMTPADDGSRFEALFDRYFELLDDAKILVTRYLVQDAGLIARAKPALQERVVAKLLSIDDTHHKHKDLIKGDVIQAFEAFFDEYSDQEQLLSFVTDQLSSGSPKTREAAKAFLETHQLCL
jgi:hypothetical protein